MGIDTRLDITTAKAIFHSEILAPLVHEGVVDAKEFVKRLKAALREPATMPVAALCLLSTAGKVAHDNLAVEAVEGLFRSSFEVHKDSDGLVSVSALSSTDMFQAWAAATRFDATSTPNEDGKQQHVNNFNDFEELSCLCERGGAQSGICLLKSAWLQKKFAEAQRTGVPFVLPSRNALPSDASYSGPITEDQVYIIALSYCWAGPRSTGSREQAALGRLRAAGISGLLRHFGDDNPAAKKLNIADREVLIFWDYPCLYQKSDATTQGVTLLQLDSFERGLGSINVLYGHVGTLCLLCTVSYPVVTRTGYKDSAWPYFESLVSTMIKDQDRAVDLPTALSWVRRVGNNKIDADGNRSIYWLFAHVRRATRQLPVDPDTFDREIVAKHATNGSDVKFLKQKFRQTFHAVMTNAEMMQLPQRARPVARPLAHLPDRHVTLLSAAGARRPFQERSHCEHAGTVCCPPRLSAVPGRLHVRRLRRGPSSHSAASASCANCICLGAWRSKAVWSLSRTCTTSRQWTWRRALGSREASWRRCQSCGPSTFATRSWTPRPSRRAAVLSGGCGLKKRHCSGQQTGGRWRRRGGSWSGGRDGGALRSIGPRRTVARLLLKPPPKTTPTWSSCCWSTAQTWRRPGTTGPPPC